MTNGHAVRRTRVSLRMRAAAASVVFLLASGTAPAGDGTADAGANAGAETWETIAERRVKARVAALAEAPDGAWVAAAGSDGSVSLWRGKEREPVVRPLHVLPARTLTASADGKLLVALSWTAVPPGEKGTSQVVVFDAATMAEKKRLDADDKQGRIRREEPTKGAVQAVGLLADPTKLFLDKVGEGGAVVDAATLRHLDTVPAGMKTDGTVVAPDGKRVVRWEDGTLRVDDVKSGREVWRKALWASPKTEKSLARCDGVRFTRDGTRLVCAWERVTSSSDRKDERLAEGVAVVDFATGALVWQRELSDPEAGGVDRVRIEQCAVGGDFVAVHYCLKAPVFALSDGAPRGALAFADENVTAVAAGRDGKSVWIGGFRGSIACRRPPQPPQLSGGPEPGGGDDDDGGGEDVGEDGGHDDGR